MFHFIKGTDVASALDSVNRQYLVGDLTQPQLLENICDSNVEMGITSYREYACEAPHYHTETTTYEYIVDGYTKYYDVTNHHEYYFSKGDVVVIRPETVYAQKSLPGTVIVFFKHPSGNDKISVETSLELESWLADWNNVLL